MKRVIKQLSAVLLTMLMVVGMVMSAWADDVVTEPTTNLAVSNMNAGDGVTAYRLVKYDSNYNKYIIDAYFDAFLGNKKSAGQTSIEYLTGFTANSSELSKVLGEYAGSDRTTYPLPSDSTEVKSATVADGETSANLTLAPGYYLMIFNTTVANSQVYNPMAVFVKMEGGTVTIPDAALVSSGSYQESAKRQDGPTIQKTVKYGTGWQSTSTAGVGDETEFCIELTIPAYSNVNEDAVSLKVEDTMANLVYVADSAQIYGSQDKAGKIDDAVTVSDISGGKQFEIDYSKLGMGTVTGSKKVYLFYRATVTAGAVNAKNGTNTAVLKYQLSHESSERSTTATSTVVYNYALKVNKTKEDGTTPLAGAKFKVYKQHNGTAYENQIKFAQGTDGSGNSYYYPAADGSVSEIEAPFVLKGLNEGNYYLEESTVPANYYAPVSGMMITLEAGKSGVEVTNSLNNTNTKIEAMDSADNSLVGETGFADRDNEFDVTIKNSSHPVLPSTGGTGTMLFTIGGVILMLVGVSLFFFRRKGKTDEK